VAKKSIYNWFSALFGLCFILIGLVAAYFSAGSSVVRYFSTSNWVEVPAQVLHLELERSSSQSDTHSLEGQYSYTFQGTQYISDQISLSSGKDNIGDYWENLEVDIRSLMRDNELSAFVNPDNPREAVLDRRIRWKMLLFGSVFVLTFGLFGGLAIWGGLSTQKQTNVLVRGRHDYPDLAR